MKKTNKIIYNVKELIREDIINVLFQKGVKKEDIERVMLCKEEENEDYKGIVTCFIKDITCQQGDELLENLKKDYPLDENTKQKVVLGIMDWVVQNDLLKAIIEVYSKLETDKGDYKRQIICENVSFQLDNINSNLLELGYDIEIVYGKDILGNIEYLVCVIEIIDMLGCWKELKQDIMKRSLIKKGIMYDGYLKKVSKEELLAVFSTYIKENEYRNEIYDTLKQFC